MSSVQTIILKELEKKNDEGNNNTRPASLPTLQSMSKKLSSAH